MTVSKSKSILALIFGIIAISGAVNGIFETLLLGNVLVPYSSLYNSGGSFALFFINNFVHLFSYAAFILLSSVYAIEGIGFGIPSLILSFRAIPGSKIKIFSRIFSIIGIGGGATIVALMIIFLL